MRAKTVMVNGKRFLCFSRQKWWNTKGDCVAVLNACCVGVFR